MQRTVGSMKPWLRGRTPNVSMPLEMLGVANFCNPASCSGVSNFWLSTRALPPGHEEKTWCPGGRFSGCILTQRYHIHKIGPAHINAHSVGAKHSQIVRVEVEFAANASPLRKLRLPLRDG